MPVETAVGQTGFLHELGDGEAADAVAADPRRGDVEDAVMTRSLRRLRRAHDLIDPPAGPDLLDKEDCIRHPHPAGG